ncbi:class I SAM-dependent methyltransferase [Algihabitans albus]|uniref:class I SAM-dependent methyltransferase n=1 Tax=Algihabitans albus TaxID=2164067 RepID=UPI000E5D7A96|nr:class I SAM-dependent methyltransferase [Algihabitans albus]
MARDWSSFYQATDGGLPRRTLLKALDLLESKGSVGFAVDLGCGAGRDTFELLRRGWGVLAIDGESEALQRLKDSGDRPRQTRLEVRLARFEDPDFALPTCDLVNASFSTPFCARPAFDRLWHQIWTSLRPGGCFAGQLLGQRDSWAGQAGITAFDQTELRDLCIGKQVVSCEEVEEDSTTVRGTPKHWHFYHLVLRKPQEPQA